MANYEIKKITKEKKKKQVAAELYRQLRAADRREMRAIVKERGTMEGEVYESVLHSEECYAAYDRTGLIAVWGHGAVTGNPGHLIWCLGTSRVADHRYAFTVESKRILTRWANDYGVLYNAVGAFNKAAIAWLKFCGAAFHQEITVGGEQFIPFTIEGEGRQ